MSGMLGRVLRSVNRINPTSRGRYRVAALARRLGCCEASAARVEIARGAWMELDLRDSTESDMYFDAFEHLSRRVALTVLRPGSVMVDVGANVGFYSLHGWARVRPSGRIVAVEANPRLAQRLRDAVARSGASGIEVLETAVGDREGQVVLHVPRGETHGHASLTNQGWNDFATIEVPMTTLDTLLSSRLERLDLLKLDIEGAEALVVAGATGLVRRFRPDILIEVNDEAAARFGVGPFDALRHLMSLGVPYAPVLVTDHAAIPLTMEVLERLPAARRNNVLLRTARDA